MTRNALEQLTKDAKKWLASKNGEEQIKLAIDEVRQMASDLQKAREVKPESLHEPVTL